jgi:hypothetical protein
MSEISREDVAGILVLLRNFPADGQLFTGNRNPERDLTALEAIALGFVELRQQTKQCSKCGAERDGHSWHVITPAGRALLIFAGDTK